MAKGSVIVVSHNSGVHIAACLTGLLKEHGWEVVLIDNASEDDTLERARKAGGGIRIVANKENLGFAGAVNQGVGLGQCSTVVIMNPDAVAHEGALDRLAETLAQPEVGAAGGRMQDERQHPQQGFFVRRFPALADTIGEILLLNRVWPSNRWNQRYRCLDLDWRRQQEVEQPAGAALAFRREAWQAIGGLDEQFYPVWFEDVDFCLRLRQQGWKILYEPEAVFSHAGGHSVGQIPFRERQVYWYRNLLRYYRKHHGRVQSGIVRLAIALGVGLRAAAAAMGIGPESVGRGEALRGYAAVFRHCVLEREGAPRRTPRELASAERRG